MHSLALMVATVPADLIDGLTENSVIGIGTLMIIGTLMLTISREI